MFAAAGAGYDLGMEFSKYSGENEAVEKNDIIQDITWAAILKITAREWTRQLQKPDNYDAKNIIAAQVMPCNKKPYQFNTQKVLDYGKLTVKTPITQSTC